MEIKITSDGYLEIERAGTWQEQYCPRIPPNDGFGRYQCGGWCPLFGEPENNMECHLPRGKKCRDNVCATCEYNKPRGRVLAICERQSLYGTVTDERGAR